MVCGIKPERTKSPHCQTMPNFIEQLFTEKRMYRFFPKFPGIYMALQNTGHGVNPLKLSKESTPPRPPERK